LIRRRRSPWASLLAFLALITLGIKTFLEWRTEREEHAAQSVPANGGKN
jgi:ABC-type sulfate transport system permease subunit